MWEPYRFCADTLPLDYDRCAKERSRKKKWTEQCSATHPFRTTICEMNIDDCIVYGNTDGEFVSCLRLIFQRFRLHNLFLNASKCKFGYSELDSVGNVISEEGLQMSRTRIQSVLDFSIPVYAKQLKYFEEQ